MIAYHAAKTWEAAQSIIDEMVLRFGKNVNGGEFTHISLEPFKAGEFALDVIGADTNQAWIFVMEIPDDVCLQDDPSGDGESYGGGWRVSTQPIPVLRILSVTFIPNVVRWEFTGFSGPTIESHPE